MNKASKLLNQINEVKKSSHYSEVTKYLKNVHGLNSGPDDYADLYMLTKQSRKPTESKDWLDRHLTMKKKPAATPEQHAEFHKKVAAAYDNYKSMK